MTRGHDAEVVVVIEVKGMAVGRDEVRPMTGPIGSGGHAISGHGVGARTGEGVRNASLIPQLEVLYVALSIVYFPATGRIRNAVIRARTSECIRAVKCRKRAGGRPLVGKDRQRAEPKNRHAAR